MGHGATSATLVPDWQTTYGFPVYFDPNGYLYASDGNGHWVPYDPSSTPAPIGQYPGSSNDPSRIGKGDFPSPGGDGGGSGGGEGGGGGGGSSVRKPWWV